MVDLYNRCLALNYFPTIWKRAYVKILPKPSKTDPNDLSSYRPIGLLPVFGKLLEKVLSKRIAYHLECTQQYHPRQFGFKEQVSTTDALQAAVKNIVDAKSAGQQVIAVSLDIKAAFDNAWWPLLLHRLRKLNCPSNLFKLTKSYLEERTATLDYGDATASKTTTKGCIQGSVCGPMFWNIILDELLETELPPGAHIQAFADDVLLIVQAPNAEKIEEITNNALQIILEWGRDAKLSFGPAKTKAIAFTASSNLSKIVMDNINIPFADEIKLLGVVVDKQLKFISHCKHIMGKANKIFKKLAMFVRPTWGAHPENISMIYKQVIQPMFTYAAGIWGGATKFYCVRKSLKAFQRQFAIRAIRAFRTVSAAASVALAQFVPLHLAIDEAREIHEVKSTGFLQDIPSDITLRPKVPMKEQLHPANRVTIDYEQAYTQDDIDNSTQNHPLKMYTDGSKLDGGEVGCAAVIYLPDGKKTLLKQKLGRTTSVFVAELTAIELGLRWIARSKWRQNVAVASDSLSALEALKDRSNPDQTVAAIHSVLRELRQNHGIDVSFTWVKAHCGIAGNEAADQAAKAAAAQKTATTLNEFPISYAKYTIRKRTLALWQEEYESETNNSEIRKWFKTIKDIGNFVKRVGASFEMTQIITGHGYHKSYLHRFKILDDPLCPCDDTSVQDITHLTQKCPVFGNIRFEHETICNNLNINPYDINELLSKEQPIESFTHLIKTIVRRLKKLNNT
ncbi:hypothetical protein ABMA28_011642 [Loxostege sticticalis]|uniref:115 kDa protein in type-1 retrotransposable element R1DM n=1 Tax=Loxostege sticticalis TaxID=481309 RepID=A0ABD0S858_LOXSC